MIELLNMDCMEYMRGLPDKAFDLAIVDPPYGIDVGNKPMSSKWGSSRLEKKDWDKGAPDDAYFSELRRVSVNQIIWCANYFPQCWPVRGYVVWDKGEGFKGRSFAECEMASITIDGNAKVYKRDPLAGGDYKGKIHPTQKPVKLYEWLLANYAKPGQRILDTHLGSASSAIAAHYFGCEFVGTELDPDYYAAAKARFDRETSQIDMFAGGVA
ncbi:site-specific DNA-methyltransferase (adenine-specific) [Modicisalibacter xianhensis]|uniref:Methyltransferase n=1 Tax=Modicisalibacter xianhensis TaxID=442341 RepID=A0A4V3GUH9_9GAMM|nr:DNA methyltransferase [Halomonas xianhensis]TDX30781.1 site-specific DNA-methyltransferase (adenine-specific) [Halomonas xianhensis]